MTLFIADTNDRVRKGLASLAACVKGIDVVGEAGDVQEAIGGIKRAKPDSVIVALPMSGGSGLDVLSVAKSTNPASVAIMLTPGPCSACRRECITLGADYVFEKSGELKSIVTTLVLLAHQSFREEFGVKSDVAQNPVRRFPNPLEQSDSDRRDVSATCPRIADSSNPKSNKCFLAASASDTTLRSRAGKTTVRSSSTDNSCSIIF